MYQSPEILDKVKHAPLRYTASASHAYARDLATVPLILDEMDLVAAHYPILFSADGEPSLLAILGLAGKNVFLDGQNRWTADYIPAFVRRYPFVLANGESPHRFYLAIDTAAEHFRSNDGESMVDDQGELCGPATKALKFLDLFQRGLLAASEILRALDTAGVLVEKTLTIQNGETTRMIGGFRVVEREKLLALPDATLADWARKGIFGLIHAHWASLRHLEKVADASSRHLAETH